MIIFKDLLSDAELVSEAFKITYPEDGAGCLMEVDGAMMKPGQESFQLEGANPSAEGEDADEGDADGDNTPVLNFAKNFSYSKIDPPSAKEYGAEAKKYLKNVMNAMAAAGRSKEEIDEFKKGAPTALKKITKNWSNYDVYLGEGQEPDGAGNSMYILVDFRDDGLTPYITLWKHALKEYKV